jgi:hypothetical protein
VAPPCLLLLLLLLRLEFYKLGNTYCGQTGVKNSSAAHHEVLWHHHASPTQLMLRRQYTFWTEKHILQPKQVCKTQQASAP